MGFFTKKKQTLSFPFDDQQNTACIVCCHILEGHPILYVSHDEDDGMWQFLCGSNHNIEDASIVSLFEVFIIVILLMIVHEYFHAITFSKKEDIYIWFQGFGMITHCTEIKNVKEYLYTLLLPNLCITLPLSIFVIFVKLSNPLILKMIGLVSSIIILGAINDLATIVYIIRNRKQIEYLQLSGKYMYYKKK